MPRNGSGVYSKPAGTTFVPNTVIESSKVNSLADDIAADLNTARPIVAGGTGGTTAAAARTSLGFSADAGNFGVKGADIASAATTDLSAATGDYVTITGTTTITALGTSPAGTRRYVRFAGILTLTYNATSLILPTAANITTAAGDTAIFISEGSGNWRCVDYVRANGQQVAGNSAQLQGYLFGLTATTNSGTPNTNIDIAVGVAATYNTPYTLITLASAITKNTNNSWAVGTGNGSLDTGAIANSTYYGYLIQRSDTGVVDVLTSLSSTSPTMPANYDRRSPALFTFVRTAGVNSVPIMLSSLASDVKAWVNFNGTGTVAIRASKNVSSITDNGTGDYSVLFITPLVDANYAWVGSARSSTTNGWVNGSTGSVPVAAGVRVTAVTTGPTAFDPDYVSIIVTR